MSKVTIDGRAVAQSDDVRVVEGNVYFPGASVDRESLVQNQTEYTCPWKGEATYYDLVVGGRRVSDAAWAYHQPKPAASEIAGHFAFDTSKGIEVVR